MRINDPYGIMFRRRTVVAHRYAWRYRSKLERLEFIINNPYIGQLQLIEDEVKWAITEIKRLRKRYKK